MRALVVLGVVAHASAWWSEGTLPTDSNFAVYVGKFCFDFVRPSNQSQMPDAGFFAAEVHGSVKERKKQNQKHRGSNSSEEGPEGKLWMLVFSDQKDHWLRARPFWDELSCQERVELANWALPISSQLSRRPNDPLIVNVRQGIRPRFWYFTFVNCGAEILEPVTFQVHAQNPHSGFQAEFGMDVRGSFSLEAIFGVLFALAALATGCLGVSRNARLQGRGPSPLLRLVCASAVCSMAGAGLRAVHHWTFASNGRGVVLLAVLGAGLACVAKALLTILQFSVARGWAIFYSPDDWPKRFMFLSGVSTVVFMSVGCEIWEQYFHDQSTAFYHYESWPGRLILLLNCCLLVSALTYMWGTFKREPLPEIRTFYMLVTGACGVYFAALPVVCLLAETLSPWVRRKIVERTELSMRFTATVLLLLCLRPSNLDGLVGARLKNGDQPELLEKSMEEVELS